jgi:2-C-methyl-D-erythritol 2,4-cyclodiphosphate synthase
MRIGIGYDIHRFQEGRPLVLGGFLIPGEEGLGGHSDADVLLHAVTDAILGAAGLGDIGQHFPPGDPAYKDAASSQFLTRTMEMVHQAGHRLENVDATLVAERPRLAPYIAAIRHRLALALRADLGQVSVKATTNEGLGTLGRGEGIAAIAIALLAERP